VIGAYIAGIRFQAIVLRRSPASLIVLATTPFLTLAFALILKNANQPNLAAYAILGPAIMSVWGMALMVSGDVIASDRSTGTFEAVLTTPTFVPALISGRITTVTLASLLSVPESMLTARIVFGISIPVVHPVELAVVIVATTLAMAWTATAFAALFVIARSARTFQNSLSYPFYLLSGAVVPVALLPGWLHPVARVVFLSWSSDLIRECLRPGAIAHFPQRIGVIIALGAVSYVIAIWMLQAVLRRIRSTGTAGRA